MHAHAAAAASTVLPAVAPLLPVICYLGAVSLVVATRGRLGHRWHAGFIAAGLLARLFAESWQQALAGAVTGLLVMAVGILMAGRLVGGVTLMALAGTVTLGPGRLGWVTVAVGLGLCVTISVVSIVRTQGVQRVHLRALQTADALGVSSGRWGHADLARLPTRAEVEGPATDTNVEDRAPRTMLLAAYLLVGAVLVSGWRVLGQ